MISVMQAVILGLLQSPSELLPVSSLGHSVILPQLFGWNIHQNDNSFLIFLVATHFAAALVLLYFYRRMWINITKDITRSLQDRDIKASDHDAKLGWFLIIGTVPTGMLGNFLSGPNSRGFCHCTLSRSVLNTHNHTTLVLLRELSSCSRKSTTF